MSAAALTASAQPPAIAQAVHEALPQVPRELTRLIAGYATSSPQTIDLRTAALFRCHFPPEALDDMLAKTKMITIPCCDGPSEYSPNGIRRAYIEVALSPGQLPGRFSYSYRIDKQFLGADGKPDPLCREHEAWKGTSAKWLFAGTARMVEKQVASVGLRFGGLVAPSGSVISKEQLEAAINVSEG